MLQLKVETLADEARVSVNTISRFEQEKGLMRRATEDAIRRVIEARGGEIFPDGVTVRARAQQQAENLAA